jgi:hypothetical protein
MVLAGGVRLAIIRKLPEQRPGGFSATALHIGADIAIEPGNVLVGA